jgi:flagellar protein FlbD
MILVTRLNGSKYYINAEQIFTVESTPDTVIGFIDGNKLIVRENAAEIAERVVAYFRKVRRPLEPGEKNLFNDPV